MAKATAPTRSRELATRISAPIGFFTLALLIVETFLGAVLALAELDATLQAVGLFTGVGLFVLVVVLVFLLVWNKPQHLVFNHETHLAWEKLQRERRRREAGAPELEQLAPIVEHALEEQLASDEVVAKLAGKSSEFVAQALRLEAIRIAEEINRSAFIAVDLSTFNPKLDTVRYPLAALKDVSSLTDEVYFALSSWVHPYYYGVDWVLRDRSTGRLLLTRRLLDGIPPGSPYPDTRDLASVGIVAGTELEAVKPIDGEIQRERALLDAARGL